jgi:hypothetical protein
VSQVKIPPPWWLRQNAPDNLWGKWATENPPLNGPVAWPPDPALLLRLWEAYLRERATMTPEERQAWVDTVGVLTHPWWKATPATTGLTYPGEDQPRPRPSEMPLWTVGEGRFR